MFRELKFRENGESDLETQICEDGEDGKKLWGEIWTIKRFTSNCLTEFIKPSKSF